ncbi:MAG: flagellar motor protein PomA [Hyphomicrobiales bacterium]|nr:MAG: flagellar motor protein PomA [Hyphomicrobiales bacterium]
MDFATIIGIVVGTIVVAGAIFMGGDFMTFVNLPSVLIVVGGALAATVLRFPLSGIMTALVMGSKVAFTQKKTTPLGMIDEITNLSSIIRKSGPLGLENVEVQDDFLAKGVQYIADGYEESFIIESLERERDLTLERLDEGKSIFKAMGDSAPAFGMIGTLVGLVQMLSTMDDPSTIGPSMAVALLTTLYGAIIANMICLPIADKLSMKANTEEINLSLAIDGIMQIRQNKSPDMIKEMLIAYLPEKQRVDLAEAA